ncbi:HAMP domain-containing histidine kinase [Corynebacterium tapiri]|uniref:Sensor histidine kinase MtrB n=2 Tax=Corynebacterium tapiri TaxID=1448266 RepID=A0A5C4U4L1_9CORY|nr:HAMP domain-containing histidine kinase [Corynebacterium tapiri]
MLLLGFALASMFSQRLVDAKIDIASNEIDRARSVVEQQVNASGTNASLQARLNSARAALTQLPQQPSEASSAFESVLLVDQSNGGVVTSPENYRIPDGLQHFVSEGQVSYQFAETERADGSRYNALIIGTPTDSDIPNLQVYLVMSMESEEATLALMRGLLALAAGVVVVLLVAVVWLATQQVTTPVRAASRIAQRLAAGHLRERMAVNGEDEMARLALSFNDMADKLSNQIHQLEEYGDLQRQFTSDVSHELRTPLTTVRMAADLIAADADDFEPHTKRATELMIRELDRFEVLLGDLLEISRHDAGVADLSTARIDARQCLESAWEQTQHLAQQLDVEVRYDVPEEPVWFVGDSRRIERILRNLIANAIDHSEHNPVDIKLKANEDTVAYTVTDHGVGLKPGQEALVFNRFWRADASRKRHSGGTGLGLAIAQEDAVLHGGTLDAAGTFGVGSQFRLVLPREPGDPVDNPAIALHAPGEER